MKNKWLFSSLLWGWGIGVLCAQSDFVPKIIPQSPNAASLGKYGDVPITLNTGQINPNIPIYEIKLNDFSFPISLSYSSSGLKTNETPSWVGLGWTLSATGVINRQLRGIPDETTHGFNGEFPTGSTVKSIANGGYTPVGTYASVSELDFKKRIAEDYQYDSEPDMFVLSCAGLGGKFFFDETQTGTSTKKPVWIPDQRLKLEAEFDLTATGPGYDLIYNAQNTHGKITKFTVKDTGGVEYLFENPEKSVEDDEVTYGRRLTTAWYLSKITTPNGHILDFTYKSRRMEMPPAVSQQKYILLVALDNPQMYNPGLGSPVQTTINETVLEKITINGGTGGEVLFVEETGYRSDWGFGAEKSKALSEIIIKNQAGVTVRSFKFNYAADVNRLLLRSVQEKNGTEEIPAHQFEYVQEGDIPPLPSLSTNLPYLYKEDFWGYYNSNSTNLLIPSLTISGNNLTVDPSTRQPEASKSVIGQLKKITYPTKGTTEFEWEGHTYSEDANQPKRYTACNGTMQTVASVSVTGTGSDAIIQTSTFTITNATQCTELYQYMRIKNNADIIMTDITINDSNGFNFYADSWERNAAILPDDGEIRSQTKVFYLPPGTYTLQVVMTPEGSFSGSGLIAVANVEFRQIVPPSGTNFVNRNAGGVRIKKVQDCPASSSGCLIKLYDYTQPAQPALSSGVLVNSPVYDFVMRIDLPTNPSGTGTAGCYVNIPHLVLTSSSQLPIATTLGSHLSYKYVKVTEINEAAPTVTNGKTTYQYSTSNDYPDLGSEEFPFAPKTSYEWRRGNLVDAQMFNTSANVVKQTANVYSLPTGDSLSYNQYIGVKFGLNHLITCPAIGSNKGFAFAAYRIVSGFSHLSATAETLTLTGGTVTTQTSYEYTNLTHLQTTATQTTDSQNKTVRTEMKYPDDLLSDPTLGSSATALKGKNMISIPLQQITKVGTQTTKTQKSFYENTLVPTVSKIEVYEGSSTNPQTVSFTDYDNRGNLLSFNQNLVGPSSTYLWAYQKLLPIAEIKNATKSQVSSALALISIGGVFMDFDKVAALTSEADILSLIGQLRTQLPAALITGLVHTHLVGVTQSINTAGQTTKFEYDGLGRLKKTSVQNGSNVSTDMQAVAEYQYLYKSN